MRTGRVETVEDEAGCNSRAGLGLYSGGNAFVCYLRSSHLMNSGRWSSAELRAGLSQVIRAVVGY